MVHTINGCQLYPANNIWNTDISGARIHANSANMITMIGPSAPLQPYFGAVSTHGIPITLANNSTPLVAITLDPTTGYPAYFDAGPYPIPPTALVENGSGSTADRHVLVIQTDTKKLYEMYRAFLQGDNSWIVDLGCVFDLTSNALHATAGSCDASGSSITQGLITYDEVQAGLIEHAMRMVLVVGASANYHVWPARHHDGSITDPNALPEGIRMRLKASTNISGFSATNQVILQGLKTYGAFVVDRGPTNLTISGVPDSRWSDTDLANLNGILASDFEVLDESALMVSALSGEAAPVSRPASFMYHS
jgi:hypothetical protein